MLSLSLRSQVPQRGSVTILVAFALVMLLGFAGLAIDVAYLFVVRNELQTAADAAALSAAAYLLPGPPIPNCDLAKQKAATAVALNKSSNVTLASGTYTCGYWNVTGSPSGIQALPMAAGANDMPAIQVQIDRKTGFNGGEVGLFFLKALGIKTAPVGAKATAVVSRPSTVGSGALLPFALAQCMYSNGTFWNPGNPNAVPPVPAGPAIDPATKLPYVLKLGSAYHYSTCNAGAAEAGQWTSFALDQNSSTAIKNLITNGNPSPLSIGDNTWIEPGTKTDLYPFINACSAAGDKTCEYVNLPVVTMLFDSKGQPIKGQIPVVGFACFHIDLAVGGSGKYIQGYMSSNCKTPNSGGSGPNYGTVTPAKLVQ